jgi:predicted HicB family RNase H-like nuclease
MSARSATRTGAAMATEPRRPRRVQTCIRLPKELHERLVRLATAEQRSLNNLLTVLLNQAAAAKEGARE